MNLSFLVSIRGLWGNAGFQRYFRNTGWLLLSRIITLVISFLATIFIARNLGPINFGQLSYAVSYISIFSFIASLGIDNILYRELIRDQEHRGDILGSALAIKLAAGAFAALLAVFSASFFAQDVSTVLIVILSGTYILNAFQIINYQFQAVSESYYPATITVLVTIILNALKIIVIYFHKGVIYLSLVLLLESALYAIFFLIAYYRKYRQLNWQPRIRTMTSMLRDSWPLIFSTAFMLIYSRIDQVFIKHMIDVRSVGVYDAAVRLAEVWYFIPGIIVTALFPAIVNAKERSEILYRSRVKKLGLFLFVIAAAVSSVVTLIAPLAMRVIYGEAFLGGVVILQIYVWASIGVFLGVLATNFLITENYKKILFAMSLIPMVSNVLLNIWWIPQYGISGAAFATLISYSLAPLSLLFFRQTRHIFNLRKHD